MELWIRVQKNEKLIQGIVKIDNLFVDTDTDKKWCIQQSGDTLGIYETEERALEVLDEIQDLMRSLTDSDLKIIQYEMPQE